MSLPIGSGFFDGIKPGRIGENIMSGQRYTPEFKDEAVKLLALISSPNNLMKCILISTKLRR